VLGHLPAAVVDLGTGGGVPGLVLAWDWPRARIELVDANARRGDHLRQAITDLGIESRVRVHTARAEIVAHDPALRESAELVTARSFGPPALTAEVGAGFAAIGGLLVVSEPPGGDVGRWPAASLDLLGFGPPQLVSTGGRSYAAIRKTVGTATTVPRSTKQLAKRPAW
jgi:16S rRNA (guanine527-N7)-methyltransferase